MKSSRTRVVTLIVLLFLTAGLSSHLAWCQEPTGKRIRALRFEGLGQTEESTLQKEMLLSPGQEFNSESFTNSIQNIRNLRIHRLVEGSIQDNPDGTVDLVVTIVEKQTLLPFFRIKRGGGATLIVLGIGDLNSFGRAIELLPMYENLNSKYHAGKLEFRIPQLTDYRMILDGSTGYSTRIHNLYSNKGAQQGSYFQGTLSWRSALELPISRLVSVAAGFELSRNEFSSEALNSQQKRTNRKRSFEIPEDDAVVAPMVRLDIGKVNYNDYRLQGTLASFGLDRNIAASGSRERELTRLSLQLKSFAKATSTLDVSIRGVAKTRLDGTELDDCALGGFGEIRGFLDERFHGASCWFVNLEARQIVYQHKWAVLQPTLFLDTGRTATSTADLGQWSFAHDPFSSGAGIRVVFPSLARLALRVDYAAYHHPNHAGESLFSLGSQQFF